MGVLGWEGWLALPLGSTQGCWCSEGVQPLRWYQVPHLKGSAGSMVRCHLESRAWPSVGGTGGTGAARR